MTVEQSFLVLVGLELLNVGLIVAVVYAVWAGWLAPGAHVRQEATQWAVDAASDRIEVPDAANMGHVLRVRPLEVGAVPDADHEPVGRG